MSRAVAGHAAVIAGIGVALLVIEPLFFLLIVLAFAWGYARYGSPELAANVQAALVETDLLLVGELPVLEPFGVDVDVERRAAQPGIGREHRHAGIRHDVEIALVGRDRRKVDHRAGESHALELE